MNYFAHGHQYRDQPYFLAGTAIPDWLNVVNRQVRVRRRAALPFVEDCDPQIASIARGIVKHHDDDAWFHASPTFNDLMWKFMCELKAAVPLLTGLQLQLLAHILVEILLDAELIARHPVRLEEYYQAMAALDGRIVESAINRMAKRKLPGISRWIDRFINERFLADYADDERLLWRLNQVMARVRLDPIPNTILSWFDAARTVVKSDCDRLVTPPRDNRPSSESRG